MKTLKERIIHINFHKKGIPDNNFYVIHAEEIVECVEALINDIENSELAEVITPDGAKRFAKDIVNKHFEGLK